MYLGLKIISQMAFWSQKANTKRIKNKRRIKGDWHLHAEQRHGDKWIRENQEERKNIYTNFLSFYAFLVSFVFFSINK